MRDRSAVIRRGRPAHWHVVLGLGLPSLLLVFNMIQVQAFTVDDAYISFRYARNFARGLGLVYNPGEHVEGYTNFLWTLLLGFGVKAHLDPEALAKILGGVASLGSLGGVYLISGRLQSFVAIPCVATWLMATSIVQSGYAVFGLETSLFTCLVLVGLILFFNERDGGSGFPLSGVVFGLAGLTRPEAPMFLGIPMLLLGRRFFERQNIVRGLCFAGLIGGHALWRQAYYGTWLPNTLSAKTGNLTQQLGLGERYFRDYAQHAWPVLILACVGFYVVYARYATPNVGQEVGAPHADFETRSVIALGGACAGYVLLVGGDWMPYFRFLGPFEPFCFLLACVGVRSFLDSAAGRAANLTHPWASWRRPLAALAAASLIGSLGIFRVNRLIEAQGALLMNEKVFWDSAAGEAATWLRIERPPGQVAVADIGFVGYSTDFPILDLLGLVDPVISKLPGGYTQKTGTGYVERVFDQSPEYFVLVGGRNTCEPLVFPAQERLRLDERFQRAYRLGAVIHHSRGGVWCIFERHAPRPG